MRLHRAIAVLLVVLPAWVACGGTSTPGDDVPGDDVPGDDAPGDDAPGDDAPDIGPTGNPDGECLGGVPAGGAPVDTSNPDAVVGDGTPESCTFEALRTAVEAGGIVTFDCGEDVKTIVVTETIELRTDVDTVIDGGRKIVLSGGDAVRILYFYHPDFRQNATRVTLQHIALVHGKTTPVEAIPPAPPPCSQGYNDGEGAALYMRDGNLTVIDALFTDNHAAELGPDTGGGAIYVVGSRDGMIIVDSTFTNNTASNAAAVGGLFCHLNIYDSLFTDNTATGHDANNDDMSQCSAMNNGQYQTGSGGNGGAIYSDGADMDVYLCGDAVLNNHAGENAFGGGLFFTSNDFNGTLSIIDTTMQGNTGGWWTVVETGSVDDAGTAVGTNAESIVIENSSLQGL
jgi:hypothetical protein